MFFSNVKRTKQLKCSSNTTKSGYDPDLEKKQMVFYRCPYSKFGNTEEETRYNHKLLKQHHQKYERFITIEAYSALLL